MKSKTSKIISLSKRLKYTLNVSRRIIYTPLHELFLKLKVKNIIKANSLMLNEGYMWAHFVTVGVYVSLLYDDKCIYESLS